MDNLSPEFKLAGPVLIFVGALVSFIGISINLFVALNEYEDNDYDGNRPLY